MKKNIFILLISLIFSSSCNDSNSKRTSFEANVISVENINFAPLNDLVEEVSFVRLKEGHDALIGRIDKVIVTEEKYFIFDFRITKSLYVFSKNGEFLFKLNKQGRGPNEYFEPIDFIVTDQSIEILDRTDKIVVYDTEGNYKSYTNLPFNVERFTKTGPDNYIFYSKRTSNTNHGRSSDCRLIAFNIEMKSKVCLLGAPDSFLPQLFNEKNVLNSVKDETFFSSTFNDSIYSVRGDNINIEYLLDFGQSKMSADLVNPYKNGPDAVIKALNENVNKTFHQPGLFGGKDYLITGYKQDKSNWIIINRSTDNYGLLEPWTKDVLSSLPPFYPPRALVNNQVYSIVEPYIIKEWYDYVMKNNIPNVDVKLLEFTESIIDNSDLVLVRYTLKNF